MDADANEVCIRPQSERLRQCLAQARGNALKNRQMTFNIYGDKAKPSLLLIPGLVLFI
jgi:hypothetical protein